MKNSNYDGILGKLNLEKMADPTSRRVLEPYEQEAIFCGYEDFVKETHNKELIEMLEEERDVIMDGIDRVSMAKDGKAFIFFGDSSLLTLYALLAQLDDYNNALTVADYQHWSYDAVYPATNYLYRKLRNLKQRYGVK